MQHLEITFVQMGQTRTVPRYVNKTKVFSYTNEKLLHARWIDVDCDENVNICTYGSLN